MGMTQSPTPLQAHPDRQRLHQRAEQLIAAFEETAPQTVTEITRAARALIVLDRMLVQLWTEPGDKPARRGKSTPPSAPATNEAPEEEETDTAPLPLNRQQRRALAARTRATPQFMPSNLHHETG
jgi:hypothetical protein